MLVGFVTIATVESWMTLGSSQLFFQVSVLPFFPTYKDKKLKEHGQNREACRSFGAIRRDRLGKGETFSRGKMFLL